MHYYAKLHLQGNTYYLDSLFKSLRVVPWWLSQLDRNHFLELVHL